MANDNQQNQQQLDETVPGGVYVKDGQVVDAEGKPKQGWTVDADGAAVGPAPKGKKTDKASDDSQNQVQNTTSTTTGTGTSAGNGG